MDWKKLKIELAAEAREYLADLRDIRDGLRTIEGWIAMALVVAACAITVAWAVVSLGFSPANEHVMRALYQLGLRTCRPIENVAGVILFVNLFMLLFLTVVSFGNVLILIGRVKRHLPKEPRDLIVSTSLMLVAGIGGIAYMLWIC